MHYLAIPFFGKPGSGKGTQAKLLVDKLGFELFSVGKMLREEGRKDTFLGKKIDATMDRGDLLPYWLAIYFFEDAVFKLPHDKGIITEGTIRTEPEAHVYHDMMQWLERPYKGIMLDVPEEELLARILKRKEIEGRDDDTKDVFQNRLDEFNNDTAPAIAYLESQGNVIHIDGDRSIEEIHTDICKYFGLS